MYRNSKQEHFYYFSINLFEKSILIIRFVKHFNNLKFCLKHFVLS